jgi:hypothetical protein
MIKNGVEGAATCAEVFEPHYLNHFHLNAISNLESAVVSNASLKEIGGALAGYYRMSDYAGPYIEFDSAPIEVQDLDLCMRDAAMALIRKAGGNPDDFNTPPTIQSSAYER